jgi:ribonuclease D
LHAKHVEPTPTERFRAEALWTLVQALSAGRSIDPALVVSRNDISEFHRLLQSNGDVESHRLMQGWRREAVGRRLLEIVRGKHAVNLTWANESLRAS